MADLSQHRYSLQRSPDRRHTMLLHEARPSPLLHLHRRARPSFALRPPDILTLHRHHLETPTTPCQQAQPQPRRLSIHTRNHHGQLSPDTMQESQASSRHQEVLHLFREVDGDIKMKADHGESRLKMTTVTRALVICTKQPSPSRAESAEAVWMLLQPGKENELPPLWTHSHHLEDLAREMGHHLRPEDSTG
jgi:hypothetical protein